MFAVDMLFDPGAGGAPDDVEFSDAIPVASVVLDAVAIITTPVAASTLRARDAGGGGGVAITSAMDSASAGRARDNSDSAYSAAEQTTVFIRRSDSGIGGRVILFCVPALS